MDAFSDSGTASSSGMQDADVAFYFNRAIYDKVLAAEKQLKQENVTCCVTDRDFPAGRTVLANAQSAADHCSMRVFIITKKFIEEDFKYYEAMLSIPEVSTKNNTHFLVSGRHLKDIPKSLRHFESQNFPAEITGQLIARFVLRFMKKHSVISHFENSRHKELDVETAEDGEEQGAACAPDNATTKELDIKFKRFEKFFGKPNMKRAYILVTSPIGQLFPGLQNIALIPWLRVFDFDPKSRVSGLLSTTEPILKSTRHHTKTDLLDEIDSPEDKITNWVFINGYSDSTDTLHLENKPLNKQAIYKHSLSLSEYCMGKKVHIFLIMWYPKCSNMDANLDKLLTGLEFGFTGTLGSFNCILCLEKMPDSRTPLYRMLRRLELLDNTLVVPLQDLCRWLEISMTRGKLESKRTLPKFSEEEEKIIKAEIAEEEYNWIDVHFDLLTEKEEQPSSGQGAELQKGVLDDGLNFLKGGEITWNVVSAGVYDARRELLEEAKKYLYDRNIKNGISGFMTIFHFPGGGGTTFARRLLWELRESAPCLELTSIQVNIDELRDRLQHLRQETYLPIVLLADGRSEHDIKKLMDISREIPLIIIQVKRYYSYLKEATVDEEIFYLPDVVRPKEADQLSVIYQQFVPKKSRPIEALSRKINSGKRHALFEFGLTAFQTEFKGVKRYVHGFLQLQPDEEPKAWHLVLAYLSIAYYYGQRALPSNIFSKILGKEANDVVELDDLPHSASQFITEDRDGKWKITHYIVSREILEQILVKREIPDYASHSNELSEQAKSQLCDWALKFIENIKAHIDGAQRVPGHISDVLTSVFIKRHYRDPGENELDNKSHYSRLMEETGKKKDQRAILKKLVECFPSDAEFHAHLGRFYYKQYEFNKAEECLAQAVERRRRSLPPNQTSKGDEVLKRIYNMFGFCFRAHLQHAIGARLGFVTPKAIANKSIPKLIRLCLEKAVKAIENFENGAKWYQRGSDPTFAYLGEIKVRLHLTELAMVISGGEMKSLESRDSPYSELYHFAAESFHECDHLLAQCIYYSSEVEIPEDELNLCIGKFKQFFKNAEDALRHWAEKDTSVRSKRCHISLLKMDLKKHSKGHRFRIYSDVATRPQLMKLVSLFEGVFNDVFKRDDSYVVISNYMMEWLQAIRHEKMTKVYSQGDVLINVKKWEARKEMGSLATFYRYIITTVLSICSPRGKVSDAYSHEAAKLVDRIENHAIPLYLMDRSMEWLAVSENVEAIDNLVHISALGERNGSFWGKEKASKLRVCTGTIFKCRVFRGQIVLDGGQRPQIVAFFVPQKYGISASHSKKRTRVEFYLGFNPRHKAEAFQVTILRKYPCPNPSCKEPTEVSKLGREVSEWTAQCNRCETLVKASE